jgi:ferredoxin
MSRLALDPVACRGAGACADLLPEAIALDEWGYPLLAPGELPPRLERPARSAVRACPAAALRLLASSAGVQQTQTTPRPLTGNAQEGRAE